MLAKDWPKFPRHHLGTMSHSRSAGVLLPVASLPSAPHCGDFGRGARRFVDHLVAHGFDTWQLLPLHPTDAAYGYSPYSAQSCFAIDECYASVRDLLSKPLRKRVRSEAKGKRGRIDYASAKTHRAAALGPGLSRDGRCRAHRPRPVAQAQPLGRGLRVVAGDGRRGRIHRLAEVGTPAPRLPTTRGPGRRPRRVRAVPSRRAVGGTQGLRQPAGRASLSAISLSTPTITPPDVWANRAAFKLTKAGKPRKVAGVPPDYFSADGQLWGNPVYDWPTLAAEGFTWWVDRVAHALQTYDVLRLDHFIGLVRAYEVGASAKTAKNGRYVDVPTDGLFAALEERLGALPIVAEDLGADIPAVRDAMARWGLPGMRVLQFGFGDAPTSPHLPHNYVKDCVAYTGTHDNDTLVGWHDAASGAARKHFRRYGATPKKPHREQVREAGLRLVFGSVASVAIAPVQDILGLPAAARTNTPGTTAGNWVWRAAKKELYAKKPWRRAAKQVERYGRHLVKAGASG